MFSKIFLELIIFCLIFITPGQSISIARILKANYSTTTSFQQMIVTSSNACMCTCINHPHCLSFSVSGGTLLTYYCQLFATYPSVSSDLSSSPTSNVTVLVGRTLSSVYNRNSTQLFNPSKLFVGNSTTWTPAFKLFTGNNQSFLWFNSTNSTTLTPIPSIPVNRTDSNWYSALIVNWTQGTYKPRQVAVAFIVNRSAIIDFLIFNTSQTNVTSWLGMSQLVSTQFWPILSYQSYSESSDFKAVYTDNVCTRPFNCNFKLTTTSCSADFIGFFFVYSGYTDECIAAVTSISLVRIPSIFYNPKSTVTNGNFSSYSVADGLMVFVR